MISAALREQFPDWEVEPRGPVGSCLWAIRPRASHGPPKGMRTMEHGHESPLQIEVSRDDVVATVTATGELDITTAAVLTERLLAVAAWHPKRLVLDLSGLVFVDIAGARALDDVHTLLQTVCPVILRQPRPSARKIFGIAGLMGN